MKSRSMVVACAVLTCFLAGCVSADKKAAPATSSNVSTTETSTAAAKPDKKKPVKEDDEYTYYYPMGSWVPVKVKKSALKPTEQETQDAQDGLSELQRRGAKLPKDS